MIVPATVPAGLARQLVPRHLRVLSILPGHTLGGLLLARYGAGSTLAYRELLVVGALVRGGGRIGLWVPSIWVDQPASAAAGHALWGLPKELASFDDDDDDEEAPVVRGEDRAVLRLAAGRSRLAVPLPLVAGVFGHGPAGELWTPVHGVAAIGAVRARVQLPPDSPIRLLGLRTPGFALSGRGRLTFRAARALDAGSTATGRARRLPREPAARASER